MNELEYALPRPTLPARSRAAVRRPVLRNDHAAAIHDRDDIGDAVDDRLQPCFVLPQSFLRRAQQICFAVGIDDRIDLARGECLDRALGLGQAQGERDRFFGTVRERGR